MIIELFGLPASGKSTFARALASRTRVHLSSTRPLQLQDGIVGVLCFPRLFLCFAYYTLRYQRGEFRYAFTHFVLTRIAELGRALRTRQGIVVLDEGPLQALLSLDPHVSESAVHRVLSLTPATSIFVFDPTEEKRSLRQAQRTYKLRPHLSDEDRHCWEERMKANAVAMITVLRSSPRVRVLETDEDSDRAVSECAAQAT